MYKKLVINVLKKNLGKSNFGFLLFCLNIDVNMYLKKRLIIKRYYYIIIIERKNSKGEV